MAGGQEDAVRAKLAKADEYLLMAQYALEMDAYDAASSLAVSAAINGADALILRRHGTLLQGRDHHEAVTMLRRDGFVRASQQLSRVLGFKNRAQYQIRRCSKGDAQDAVRGAERLLDAARVQL